MAKLTGITGDEGSRNAIVTPLWGVRERERREEEKERGMEGKKQTGRQRSEKKGSRSINLLVMIFILS